MDWRSSTSRRDSGSSNRKQLGSRTMARATATRCFSPSEIWPGSRSSTSLKCRISATLVDAGGRARPLPMPSWWSGMAMFSPTDAAPDRARRTGTPWRCRASPAAGRSSRLPAMTTSPAVARSSPAIMRRVVVLPQPDGPSRQTTSPAATDRSTSLTAVKAPNAW